MKLISAVFRAIRSFPRLVLFVLVCTIETRRMERVRQARRKDIPHDQQDL